MDLSLTAPERKHAFVLAKDNHAHLQIRDFSRLKSLLLQDKGIIDPKDMDISQRHNNNDNDNCASEDSAQNS